MVQKMDMEDLQWTVCGMGRIDETNPIDLKKSTILYPTDIRQSGVPVMLIPKKIRFSKKVGRTVYDVTGHFDAEGIRSVLQQFRELILSNGLQN
ncbi:MAG: hypothetical protein EOM54_10625 [Clostridia bacterium]|nr:hypothetical protein [Clostridia bacterium]